MLPYLDVLKSDDGKLRLKGSFFNEDYSENQSVPENIVKVRKNGKDRLNRKIQHKRKMKKKIQRVSLIDYLNRNNFIPNRKISQFGVSDVSAG